MKVSVIMSVYNNQDFVSGAIDSILGQTFNDFEFIIINDGSTDETEKIIRRYQKQDDRIVIISQENKGLTRSLNIGIDNAKGEYIARQDADDVSLPQRLKEQVDFLDNNKVIGFAGSSFEMIDEEGIFINFVYIRNQPKKIILRLKHSNIFCHGTMVFRRNLLDKVSGYREFFRYAQDYDLYLRLITNSLPGSVASFLYKKRVSLNSISIQRIELQSAYAELAKTCHKRILKGQDDTQLMNERILSDFKAPLTGDLILLFMNSLYCVKRNELEKARLIIRPQLFPISAQKYKIYLLLIFSYLPKYLRNLLLSVKFNFRKKMLALRLNGK